MRVKSKQRAKTASEEVPIDRKTMTSEACRWELGALLVMQLLEYGHCTFTLVGDEGAVQLVEPWRVTIDGKPIALPTTAVLDALPEDEAIRQMVARGMGEEEIVLALVERDRRLKAAGGSDAADR